MFSRDLATASKCSILFIDAKLAKFGIVLSLRISPPASGTCCMRSSFMFARPCQSFDAYVLDACSLLPVTHESSTACLVHMIGGLLGLALALNVQNWPENCEPAAVFWWFSMLGMSSSNIAGAERGSLSSSVGNGLIDNVL